MLLVFLQSYRCPFGAGAAPSSVPAPRHTRGGDGAGDKPQTPESPPVGRGCRSFPPWHRGQAAGAGESCSGNGQVLKALVVGETCALPSAAPSARNGASPDSADVPPVTRGLLPWISAESSVAMQLEDKMQIRSSVLGRH